MSPRFIEVGAEGQSGGYTLSLSFDDEWAGLLKSVVFYDKRRTKVASYDFLGADGTEVEIPSTVLGEDGRHPFIVIGSEVIGDSEETAQEIPRRITECAFVCVGDSIYPELNSTAIEELDTDAYASFLRAYFGCLKTAETLKGQYDGLSQALETASGYSETAKSYAVGGTGKRSGEATDNAKYYSNSAAANADKAKASADGAKASAEAAEEEAATVSAGLSEMSRLYTEGKEEIETVQEAVEEAKEAAEKAQAAAEAAKVEAVGSKESAASCKETAKAHAEAAANSSSSASGSAKSAGESANAAKASAATAKESETQAKGYTEKAKESADEAATSLSETNKLFSSGVAQVLEVIMGAKGLLLYDPSVRIYDADNYDKFMWAKTTDTTSGLPEELPTAKRWGLICTFYENATKKTGSQFFYDSAWCLWQRKRYSGNWETWSMIINPGNPSPYKVVMQSSDGANFTGSFPTYRKYRSGDVFVLIPAVANRSLVPTLNINGLGAKEICRKTRDGKTTTLPLGYFVSNEPMLAVFDGSRFVLTDKVPYGGGDFSTAVSVSKGGTGKTSWSSGGVIYASGTTALSQVTLPTAESVLCQKTTGAPYWKAVSELGGGGFKKIGYTDDCDYKVSSSSGGKAAFAAAINAAADGDAIIVMPGEYKSTDTSTLEITKNLSFVGVGMPEVGFGIQSGSDSNGVYTFCTVNFKGFTLADVHTAADAGNYSGASVFNIYDCLVTGYASFGGRAINTMFAGGIGSPSFVCSQQIYNCRILKFDFEMSAACSVDGCDITVRDTVTGSISPIYRGIYRNCIIRLPSGVTAISNLSEITNCTVVSSVNVTVNAGSDGTKSGNKRIQCVEI